MICFESAESDGKGSGEGSSVTSLELFETDLELSAGWSFRSTTSSGPTIEAGFSVIFKSSVK